MEAYTPTSSLVRAGTDSLAPTSPMHQAHVTFRVRLIFLATFAFLTVQSLFIQRYGEPYPAIVMPGFRGSGGYQHDGRVEVVRYEAVFIAGAEEFTVAPKVLLAEFPDSHHGEIAQSTLAPRVDAPNEIPRSRLKRVRDAIFPGYAARNALWDSPNDIASLRNWLRSRGEVLVPGREISRVEIRWFRERIRVVGERLESGREPVGSLVVRLDGGP